MCNSYHLFSYFLKHIISSLLTMLSNRTTIAAALLTIAIASSLIAVNGVTGYAFAKKGKGGDSTANTMTNSGDSGSNDNPAATSSSDSQTPNTHDSSGTTDNNNTPTSDTSGGSISQKDLKTFSSCVSHDALDGRLNLAEVNDCYGQVFDQGFGHALDQSSSIHDNTLQSPG
jgi:hypothetical protein